MNHSILPSRLVICSKDIQIITGRSERTARRIMADIRKKLGRDKRSYITIEEFCRELGLSEEKVAGLLQ